MRPQIDWTTEGMHSRNIIDSELALLFGAEPSEENLEQWCADHPDLELILDSFAGCASMPATLSPVLAELVERIVARLDDWRVWRIAGHLQS